MKDLLYFVKLIVLGPIAFVVGFVEGFFGELYKKIRNK